MKIIILFLLIININLYGKNVEEIIKKVESNRDYKTSYMISEMLIYREDNLISQMQFEYYSKKIEEQEIQLLKYTSPKRLYKTAILVKNDKIWYYNNRTKRTRILAKQKKQGSMMGSSFSYDDLNISYLKNFKKQLMNNKEFYIIKLTPIQDYKQYKYLILKIDKKNYQELELKYFDENDINYKTMIFENYIKINSYLTPLKVVMINHIDNIKTEILSQKESIKYDLIIKNQFFEERNMRY